MTERILMLAEKWSNGTISANEKEEFLQWYNDAREEEILVPPGIASNEKDLREKILAGITQKIRESNKTREATIITMHWRKIAVAIAIIAIGLISYKYWNQNSPQANSLNQPTANIKPAEIPAGTNGAILTLSDGRQLALDSAGNGIIARQNTSTIRQTGGSVVYDAGSTTAGSTGIYNTMHTPRGRQYQLILSDGSKVWLNAASTIKYPIAFGPSSRKVEISGEVYFEIAKDVKRPFTVDIPGNGRIEVTGTHFNINAYPEENGIKTTLLEGSVNVFTKEDRVQLIPGQQAVIHGPAIRVENNVDLVQVVGWQKGNFEFSNTDLATLMRQISRWYNVDIVFEGPVPQKKLGGGISKFLPLEKIIKLLEANGIRFKMEGRTLKVSG